MLQNLGPIVFYLIPCSYSNYANPVIGLTHSLFVTPSYPYCDCLLRFKDIIAHNTSGDCALSIGIESI